MNNLEENLRKIKIKEITEEDRDSLWHGIMVERVKIDEKSRILSVNIFKYSMKKLIVGALALVIILGSGGVVAASNSSVPGDFLFPVDLAIEKIQIRFAGEDQKTELKFKFAEERVKEIKKVSEEKSVPVVLVTNLSESNVTEIEVDVFTNETTVKIEAGGRKYGYISALKTKVELAKEIATKYSISEEKVSALINLEIENRDSRADDKGFLNKTHSINFSERENDDVGRALTDLEELLEGNENNEKAQEIEKALKEILALLGDDANIKIEKKDGEIKIESDKIKIEIKSKNENRSNDDDSQDSDDDSDDSSAEKGDVREDDSEVFCRGEWRDLEDCDRDNDDNSDDSDDDDNSGKDDEEDKDEEENDNSGRGGGDDN